MIDTEKLTQLVGELDEEAVNLMLDRFIISWPGPDDVRNVIEACRQGMEIVGENFKKGEYFVGDLIFAGELLSGTIEKLDSLLGSDSGGCRGTIVLGTVEGDIHDIGKNIFKAMVEAAGYKVIDIGIDQAPAAFIKAVQEYKPDILGMSGVLTLSIESMKRTIQALIDAGLRDTIKVIIGGNAVSPEACGYSGADACSRNAAEAVKICGNWVEKATL